MASYDVQLFMVYVGVSFYVAYEFGRGVDLIKVGVERFLTAKVTPRIEEWLERRENQS
jgi:hypothetical protein